jgi:hypothetical protein
MEIGVVNGVIAAFANALKSSGAGESAVALQRFSDSLAACGTMSTKKFVSSIEKAGLSRTIAEEPMLGVVESEINELIGVLKAAGAKKTLMTDVELLLDLSGRYKETSIAEFESSVASASGQQPGATPMDPKQLVEEYLKRLEVAFGNDEVFRALHKELNDDKRVTRVMAIEIASRFYAPMPPSSSRPKALRKILERHEKLMYSRAASSTIGGKAYA